MVGAPKRYSLWRPEGVTYHATRRPCRDVSGAARPSAEPRPEAAGGYSGGISVRPDHHGGFPGRPVRGLAGWRADGRGDCSLAWHGCPGDRQGADGYLRYRNG